MTRFLRSPGLYNVSVPSPGPSELQIKVAYVSLNPTDCTFSLGSPIIYAIAKPNPT